MTRYLFDLLNHRPPDTTRPGTQSIAPHPADAARLSPQCHRILARLRAGPASNTALADIALKYTGRISEIRGAGHVVEVFDQDRRTGVCWYRLGTQEE